MIFLPVKYVCVVDVVALFSFSPLSAHKQGLKNLFF